MIPSLFVSHGSPTLPLDDCAARDFLLGLGQALKRPRAIVAVSAHWDMAIPTVSAGPRNAAIHDFYGFPEELYRMQYTPAGSPELAAQVRTALEASGFETASDEARGLDHGAWVPLMLMYPEADIPVLQLSIETRAGARHHYRLGQALRGLREQDILVMGSGGFVHNLRALSRWSIAAPEPAWSQGFAAWVHEKLMAGDREALLAYRALAPFAREAHPTEDHFMPLFAALGAGGPGAVPERLHSSTTYGSLRMDAYGFA